MSWLIVYILVLHWLGDFVCQDDIMAKNKSKSWWALLDHIMTYGSVLFLGCAIWFSCEYIPLLFVFTNVVLHFVTDAITSHINALLWQRHQMHWFFVMVGFDQLIHTTTLIMTLP